MAEANAMAELAGHPNIVQAFRADNTADGRPYLVMKYYPQRNMAVRSRMERLSVPEVLQIGIRIACAVETAHRVGILHRDIKPANILTSQYGEPGLTDFGIATTIGAEGCSDAGKACRSRGPRPKCSSVPRQGSLGRYLRSWALPSAFVGRAIAVRGTERGQHFAVAHAPYPRTTTSATGRDDVPASFERLLAQAMAKNPERPTAKRVRKWPEPCKGSRQSNAGAPTPLVLLEGAAAEDDSASWVLDNSAAGGASQVPKQGQEHLRRSGLARKDRRIRSAATGRYRRSGGPS